MQRKIAVILLFIILFSGIGVQASEITPPDIQPRSSWITKTQDKFTQTHWKPKRNVNKLLSDYHQPKYIIIHHTEEFKGKDSQEKIQKIFQHHAVVRGWGDIGYNYLIDEEGVIFEGRKGGNGVRGAHSLNSFNGKNYNYQSIGIAVIGDYNKEKLSSEAQNSLAELVGWLAYANNIDLDKKAKALVPVNYRRGSLKKNYNKVKTLLSHRDVDETTCPGKNLYKKLGDIKKQAQQHQADYYQYVYTTGKKQAYIFQQGHRSKITSELPRLTTNERWFDIFTVEED